MCLGQAEADTDYGNATNTGISLGLVSAATSVVAGMLIEKSFSASIISDGTFAHHDMMGTWIDSSHTLRYTVLPTKRSDFCESLYTPSTQCVFSK